jgi:hypothetical protein
MAEQQPANFTVVSENSTPGIAEVTQLLMELTMMQMDSKLTHQLMVVPQSIM